MNQEKILIDTEYLTTKKLVLFGVLLSIASIGIEILSHTEAYQRLFLY